MKLGYGRGHRRLRGRHQGAEQLDQRRNSHRARPPQQRRQTGLPRFTIYPLRQRTDQRRHLLQSARQLRRLQYAYEFCQPLGGPLPKQPHGVGLLHHDPPGQRLHRFPLRGVDLWRRLHHRLQAVQHRAHHWRYVQLRQQHRPRRPDAGHHRRKTGKHRYGDRLRRYHRSSAAGRHRRRQG